jgi:hypothetical protein
MNEMMKAAWQRLKIFIITGELDPDGLSEYWP